MKLGPGPIRLTFFVISQLAWHLLCETIFLTYFIAPYKYLH